MLISLPICGKLVTKATKVSKQSEASVKMCKGWFTIPFLLRRVSLRPQIAFRRPPAFS